ncbi:hypothetical protein AB1I91_10285 [Bacillus paranthracis]|uniref:hypothetical protein n=1 Tax=Bacillus paranthracis TaxID=2026186 RepID=UPI0007785A41|nr:hypothetical protein [Bacillus paranthracis]KXY02298.1 hypothetical protein AT271_15095 [Bacillus cereus]MDG1605783.1 hypothetical protein [Bacillus paranthracis]
MSGQLYFIDAGEGQVEIVYGGCPERYGNEFPPQKVSSEKSNEDVKSKPKKLNLSQKTIDHLLS